MNGQASNREDVLNKIVQNDNYGPGSRNKSKKMSSTSGNLMQQSFMEKRSKGSASDYAPF